jgi:hypothetical protein
MTTLINQTISAFNKYQMTSYTVGPIYSAWLFRVNNTLINLVSRHVRFADGAGIEHMPWDQDLTDDTKHEIANWLGVRNCIVDAIEDLEGGYPPSSFADTYEYLLRGNPEDNERALKQSFAMEYIARAKRGEKLHSTVQQYVEDNYSQAVKNYSTLRDVRDNVINYLENADYVKSRSSALDYGNLPDWFDEMIYTVSSTKFATSYSKKLTMLDRQLSPTTRKAIETEIFLMEQVAQELNYELPQPVEGTPAIDNAYLASLGLTNV